MPRKDILKQINALQKALDDFEKGRKRWPTNPPPRTKDTPEDRERPVSPTPDVPKKPPYQPMEDVGKAEDDEQEEGMTRLPTQATREAAARAALRNRDEGMQGESGPVRIIKPPQEDYKEASMEKTEEGMTADASATTQRDARKAAERNKNEGMEGESGPVTTIKQEDVNKEKQAEMMRMQIENSLLKLMQ